MKEINIGRVLIKNRHKRGITQDELANHLGVSKGAVSKWETGYRYLEIIKEKSGGMKTEAYFLYLFIIVYNRLEGLILNEFVCMQRRQADILGIKSKNKVEK